MPIAPSTPQQTVSKPSEPAKYSQSINKSDLGTISYNGVPVDVFRMFNADIGTVDEKDIGKMNDICKWASSKCEDLTIGNMMQKISSLERQLGSPHIGQNRWDKMWNWVKMNNTIEDLRKRQDSMRATLWA